MSYSNSLNKMASYKSISVVICFRDWGLDKLAAAVGFHMANASRHNIEVVVSDYGSKNFQKVNDVISEIGAKVVRIETDGPWNRSAALNAGVEAASNSYVITTDADMIFSPTSYDEAIRQLSLNPNALYLVQCRDLPENFGCDALMNMYRDLRHIDFKQLETASSIRPRWGMGGFAAFSKDSFYKINGYEERMKIWGKEDNDFALRFRRARMPIRWLTGSDIRIFHIWHEPSLAKANETLEGKAALADNQRILDEEVTVVRNVSRSWASASSPLVSVIIPTYKRNEQLFDALRSCVAQTFDNFEVLVIENGDSNKADSVVAAIGDIRFRYFKTEKQGAAAARNIGTQEAKGSYIVIHDDDDIMISTRIADHLQALESGNHGSYGGWIDFEDKTGEVLSLNKGKEFSFNSLLCNGKVIIHPGTMIDKRILKMFPYNENLAAGIDYGLFLNLARNGLRMNHTGKYAILRRMHRANMTRTNSDIQKSSASYMKNAIKTEIPESEYKNFRETGLAAKSMSCTNEMAAFVEMVNYINMNKISFQNNEIGSEIFVLDLDNKVNYLKKSIDQHLLDIITNFKRILIKNSKSSNHTAFLKSRLRYLANLNGFETDITSQ